MKRTLTINAVAMIAATGVAHAQMQAPDTPDGRAMNSMPGGTSNPQYRGCPRHRPMRRRPRLPPRHSSRRAATPA